MKYAAKSFLSYQFQKIEQLYIPNFDFIVSDSLGNEIDLNNDLEEIFPDQKVIQDLRIIFKVIIIEERIIDLKI